MYSRIALFIGKHVLSGRQEGWDLGWEIAVNVHAFELEAEREPGPWVVIPGEYHP